MAAWPSAFWCHDLQRLGQSLAPLLHDKIHNAGGAAHCSSDGAGAEVVGGHGTAEGKVQVRMWDRCLPGMTYLPVASIVFSASAVRSIPIDADFPLVHQDVGQVVVHCSEDVPVFDQDAHAVLRMGD